MTGVIPPGRGDYYKQRSFMFEELYCVYCVTPKGDSYACCQENHFVPFDDLYPEDQAALLEEMKDD